MKGSSEAKVLSDLASKFYHMIVEKGKSGILQSELWKSLTLTSRDGSRIAVRLEKRGMIRRERVLNGGRYTYRVTSLRIPVQLESIEQAPCLDCPVEHRCSPTNAVSPYTCPLVSNWVIEEYTQNAVSPAS